MFVSESNNPYENNESDLRRFPFFPRGFSRSIYPVGFPCDLGRVQTLIPDLLKTKTMKTIFTLLFASVLFTAKSFGQCNSAAGGNGISSIAPITIDGKMSDWSTILSDPDNNTYDNTNGVDLDAPISDAGRDLVRFAHTSDMNNFYFYLERVGSTNNTVDMLFYADINNNDLMELNEPVIYLNWSGANGSVSSQVRNYVPSLLNELVNTPSLRLDGFALLGTLGYRNNAPGVLGQGASNGKSVEVQIPFSLFTMVNGSGATIQQLLAGQQFKFHVSTINGSIGNAPSGINDNFGGCVNAAPVNTTLPVTLFSFNATLLQDNRVNLAWVTSTEMNVSHFVIERSYDGNTFTDAALVFAAGNSQDKTSYSYKDMPANVTAKAAWYRLRSVDFDGKTSLSQTRMIRFEKSSPVDILTYPNPATTELRITVPTTWQNRKVVYEVLTIQGTQTLRKENASSSQTETLSIAKLAPGMYIVRATCEGEVAQQKIIKQ